MTHQLIQLDNWRQHIRFQEMIASKSGLYLLLNQVCSLYMPFLLYNWFTCLRKVSQINFFPPSRKKQSLVQNLIDSILEETHLFLFHQKFLPASGGKIGAGFFC